MSLLATQAEYFIFTCGGGWLKETFPCNDFGLLTSWCLYFGFKIVF